MLQPDENEAAVQSQTAGIGSTAVLSEKKCHNLTEQAIVVNKDRLHDIAIHTGSLPAPSLVHAESAVGTHDDPIPRNVVLSLIRSQYEEQKKILDEKFEGLIKLYKSLADEPNCVTTNLKESALVHFGVDVRSDTFPEEQLNETINDLLASFPDFREFWQTRDLQTLTSEFRQGAVTRTTKAGVQDFLLKLNELEGGSHGVIINQNIVPVIGRYENEKHYRELQPLGKGAFGGVYLCCDQSSGQLFARKRVKKTKFNKSEASILLQVEHKNIVQLYGLMQTVFKGETYIDLLLEYAGRSLASYVVSEEKELSGDDIWDVTYQAICALEAIHRQNVIHLDVKPNNFCIQDEGGTLHVRLIDLGLAKTEQEPMNGRLFTPGYMSPEQCEYTRLVLLAMCGLQQVDPSILEKLITTKSDMFSLALVVHFMFQKTHVLLKLGIAVNMDRDKPILSQLEIVLFGGQDFLKTIRPDRCSLDMRELLDLMEMFNKDDRISSQDARLFMEEKMRSRILRVQTGTAMFNMKMEISKVVGAPLNVRNTRPYDKGGTLARKTRKLLREKLLKASSTQEPSTSRMGHLDSRSSLVALNITEENMTLQGVGGPMPTSTVTTTTSPGPARFVRSNDLTWNSMVDASHLQEAPPLGKVPNLDTLSDATKSPGKGKKGRKQ